MSAALVATVMFGLLIIFLVLRVPISFALALAVMPILFLEARVPPVMLLQRMMNSYSSFILLSIPFFLLAANIMNESGITRRLIRFSKSLVGFLPGGLGHINVAVSMLFAGLSGSSTADAAGIGSVLIPAMINEGYDRNFTVAVTACSAVMGVIIPPSINMVVWGGVMNVSVGALFLAGFIPGVMIGFAQMGLVLVYAFKRKYPREVRIDFKEILVSGKESGLALITPIIIIGGILGGIVTPTEASFLAVAYSFLLGIIIYGTIRPKQVPKLLLNTAKLSSLSLFAIGTASIYGWMLAYFRIPSKLIDAVGFATYSPTLVLSIIVGVFLLVGTFMDQIPAMVILGPLFMPLADHAGIHPLHFAITSLVALAFGEVTPPYGLCLLMASEIGGINCMRAIREVGVFLSAMIFVLVLLIIFPDISLFIPRLIAPNLFY